MTVVVVGGSGYFGTVLCERLLAAGASVRVVDRNPSAIDGVEFVRCDVRDQAGLLEAVHDARVVVNTVAQVPLAKDRHQFEAVNVTGTANVLLAARDAGVEKVVHLSSSAVYGVPERNPVDEATPVAPLEDYGRAKARAEVLCDQAVRAGLDVTIVRPRTILGHGRLGIIAVLFHLVAAGAPVYVLGRGDNRYQFVHADDLAAACILAADTPGPDAFNIGAADFGTMRETLEALAVEAGTGSVVRSLPAGPAKVAMRALSTVGLAPFAPYHWLLYAESLHFDTSHAADALGWSSEHSNRSALIESYRWYLDHRDDAGAEPRSHHQAPVPLGVLRVLERLP